MARLTRSRVLGATRSLPDRTRETVDFETPARRATSTIVTRPVRSPGSSLLTEPDISSAAFWNVLNRQRIGTHRPNLTRCACHLERDNLSLFDYSALVNGQIGEESLRVGRTHSSDPRRAHRR